MSHNIEDDRLASLLFLLTELARGDLAARIEPSDLDDDIDALIVGVNMLAEELQANEAELTSRVLARTAELEELNGNIVRLSELGNLLQACAEPDEAYDVIRQTAPLIFPGLGGALYVFNSSRNLLEAKVSWGEVPAGRAIVREDCWALRRGQRHFVPAGTGRIRCAHAESFEGNSICIPMAAHGETIGLMHLRDCGTNAEIGPTLSQSKQDLGAAVAEHAALSLANLQMRVSLRQQALKDPMTGLSNRRFIDEWIEREISRAQHADTSLGFIMLDVDHFKAFNDLHGHDAGDAALRAVAAAIRDSVRAGDIPCRYGGEEFLILVTNIDPDNLLARAEQLRATVAQAPISHLGTQLPNLTISAGVALYPQHGTTPTKVIRQADAALYEAKRLGRNRVVAATQRIGRPQ